MPLGPSVDETNVYTVNGAEDSARGVNVALPLRQHTMLRLDAPGYMPVRYRLWGTTRHLLGERAVVSHPVNQEFASVTLTSVKLVRAVTGRDWGPKRPPANGSCGTVQLRVVDCTGQPAAGLQVHAINAPFPPEM